MTLACPVINSAIQFYALHINKHLFPGIDMSIVYHRWLTRSLRSLLGSAIMSLIVALGILITLYLFRSKNRSIRAIKAYVTVVASFLVILPFAIVYVELGDSIYYHISIDSFGQFSIIELAVLFFSVFFYKLESPHVAPPTTPNTQTAFDHG
jgi:Ca2+/Na+ antiporter